MKTFCFLIILMLSALLKAAGQAVKPSPNDLVVTAEIIGHSYKPTKNPSDKPQLMLYARLNVRNQTTHPRKITFYSCGWNESWIQRGAVGFDAWGCNKNSLGTLPIPANQSIIFCGPVRVPEDGNNPTSFALGFVDFTEADFSSKAFRKYKPKRWAKLLNSRSVYWSNELSGNIDPAATPEIKGSDQYSRYSFSEADK